MKTIGRNVMICTLVLLGVGGFRSSLLAQTPGTFVPTGGMATPRSNPTATLLTSGKVLVAGGWVAPDQRTATAELYDPDSGAFTAVGDMTTPRFGHTATLLPDGRVLIVGGHAASPDSKAANGAEIYDPSTGTFTATGDNIAYHICQQAHLLSNGKVLIAGGSGRPDEHSGAEIYDPAAGTFALAGVYASAASFSNSCEGSVSSLLPDGRVLIVWEEIGAEIYDPGTGEFSTARNIFAYGHNNGPPSATLLLDGKVLFAGGANDLGFRTSAGLYDPVAETLAATGSMSTGRSRGTATLLPDGAVLMAGTYVFGGGSRATAELYDPVTGTFTPTDGMRSSRANHTATLLNDGRVLIAGGSAFGLPTTLAELYHPSVLVASPVLLSVSREGETFVMDCTGLAQGSVIAPRVTIGRRLAEVISFGAVPELAGVYQVKVRLPGGVATGTTVPVRLIYLGRASNELSVDTR